MGPTRRLIDALVVATERGDEHEGPLRVLGGHRTEKWIREQLARLPQPYCSKQYYADFDNLLIALAFRPKSAS